MKPIVLLGAVASLSIITACSIPKSNDPFAPTRAMAKTSDASMAELGKGHSIYMRHCTQCHESQIPRLIPTKEWHKIVPGMAWNAGLSEEERQAVTDYIVAASKIQPVNK